MKQCIYVIDTSYLDEYYQIDGYCDKKNISEIKKRFEKAEKNKSRLYVPVPVIFEIANHIAHGRGSQCYELAETFRKDIETSCSDHSSPFIIVPCKEFESMQLLIKNLIQFSKKYVKQGLGLTDTAVYQQAKQLSERNNNLLNLPVHIWTKDRCLKAFEPDREENPFMG